MQNSFKNKKMKNTCRDFSLNVKNNVKDKHKIFYNTNLESPWLPSKVYCHSTPLFFQWNMEEVKNFLLSLNTSAQDPRLSKFSVTVTNKENSAPHWTHLTLIKWNFELYCLQDMDSNTFDHSYHFSDSERIQQTNH